MATKQITTSQWAKNQRAQMQTATMNLDLSQFKQGNSITGEIGGLHVTGRTCDRWPEDGQTHYWNTAAISFGILSNGSLVGSDEQLSNRYNIWANTDFDQTFSGLPLKVVDNIGIRANDTLAYFGPTLSGGGYTDWNIDTTVTINYEVTAEVPTNLKQRGNSIYETIYVDFALTSSNKIAYEVLVNESVVISKETSSKFIAIPPGTIKTTNDKVNVNIKSKLTFLGDTYYSKVVSLNLSGFQTLTAERPSNLRVLGDQKDIYGDITFAWDTTDSRCTSLIEVWQDGVIVTSKSGIPNKRYVLTAGTLKNSNAIKVRVNNTLSINGYSNTSAYIELQVSDLTSNAPVISDFTLDSNNRDYEISVNVVGSNCDSFKLYVNNHEIDESLTNTLTISKGTLLKGRNSIRVVGIRTYSAGQLVGDLTKEFDIVQDEPIVYSIEPSNININVEEVSTVSFNTNTFISRWELYINGYLHESGTSGREVSVSARTFNTGENTLKVNAYYSPSHNPSEIRSSSKTATFTGYGKPEDPIHDKTIIYNTSLPTFTWMVGDNDNDEQVAFEIEIGDERKTVNTFDTSYTVSNRLNNNSRHTVRLRIKNKFEMWSNWVEKEFQVSFSQLAAPQIELTNEDGSVLVSITCSNISDFSNISVYRSIDTKNWIELANDLKLTDSIVDCSADPNREVYYKARVYNNSGSFGDSDINSINVKVKNYNLVNVKTPDNGKRVDFASVSFSNNFNSVKKIFSGAKSPVVYKDNINFYTVSMTVKIPDSEADEFFEYINRGDIFCYRDYRGKKIFAFIDIVSIAYINPFVQEFVLSLTEVNFNETLMYNNSTSSGLVYLNGQYYLDGSINLSGMR